MYVSCNQLLALGLGRVILVEFAPDFRSGSGLGLGRCSTRGGRAIMRREQDIWASRIGTELKARGFVCNPRAIPRSIRVFIRERLRVELRGQRLLRVFRCDKEIVRQYNCDAEKA